MKNVEEEEESGGRERCALSGRVHPHQFFAKAFQSAAALVRRRKALVRLEASDRPWDIFMPVLSSFNEASSAFSTVLLMLDEYVGLASKTSRQVGCQTYHIPSHANQLPLGTMLRNCLGGQVPCFQEDVVQPKYSNRRSTSLRMQTTNAERHRFPSQ
jgi:hypothetical protein